ncbi:MAG: hypothetical protein H6Q89_693, partial [Myxococcaceae bacterium]|nr:hypothetical protein [Myxococcaceae bacterium]
MSDAAPLELQGLARSFGPFELGPLS